MSLHFCFVFDGRRCMPNAWLGFENGRARV